MLFAKTSFIFLIIAGALGADNPVCLQLYEPLGNLDLSTDQLAQKFNENLQKTLGFGSVSESKDIKELVKQIAIEDLNEFQSRSIKSIEELNKEISTASDELLADAQKRDDAEVLASTIAGIVLRYQASKCPFAEGYSASIRTFQSKLNKYTSIKPNGKTFFSQVEDLLNKKIEETSQPAFHLLCNCRNQRSAAYLYQLVDSLVPKICGNEVQLTGENISNYIDRIAAMANLAIQIDENRTSFIVSKIWSECNLKYMKEQQAPQFVKKFGLKANHEILLEAYKDKKNHEEIRDSLRKIVEDTAEELDLDIAENSAMIQAKFDSGYKLDFADDKADESRLYMTEVLYALGSSLELASLSEQDLETIVKNFQTAFNFDADELFALAALGVARSNISQLKDYEGTAEEEEYSEAQISFIDTLVQFIVTKRPTGTKSEIIIAFDKYLDSQRNEKPVANYYQLFKLINLSGFPSDDIPNYTFGWQRSTGNEKELFSKLYPSLSNIANYVSGSNKSKIPFSDIKSYIGYEMTEEEAAEHERHVNEAKDQTLHLSPISGTKDGKGNQIPQDIDEEDTHIGGQTGHSQNTDQPVDTNTSTVKKGRSKLEKNPDFVRKHKTADDGDSHYVFENRLHNCNAIINPKKVPGQQQPNEEINLYFDENGKKIDENAFAKIKDDCLATAEASRKQPEQKKQEQPKQLEQPKQPEEKEVNDPNAFYYVQTHYLDMNCNEFSHPTKMQGKPKKGESLELYIQITDEDPKKVLTETEFKAALKNCGGAKKIVMQPIVGKNYIVIEEGTRCRFITKPVERAEGEERDQYFYQIGEIGAPRPSNEIEYKKIEAKCNQLDIEPKEQQYVVTVFTVGEDCKPTVAAKNVFGKKPHRRYLFQQVFPNGIRSLNEKEFKIEVIECQKEKMLWTETHTLMPDGVVLTEKGFHADKRPDGLEEVNYFKKDGNSLNKLDQAAFKELTKPKEADGHLYILDKIINPDEKKCSFVERKTLKKNSSEPEKVRYIKTSKDASAYSTSEKKTEADAAKLEEGEELIDQTEYERLAEQCNKKPEIEISIPDLKKTSVVTDLTISDGCEFSLKVATTYGAAEEQKFNYFAKTGLNDIRPIGDEAYTKAEDKCLEQPTESTLEGKAVYITRNYVLQNCAIKILSLQTTEKPAEGASLHNYILMSGENSTNIGKKLFLSNWENCKRGIYDPAFTEEDVENIAKSLTEEDSEEKVPVFIPPIADAVLIYYTEVKIVTTSCNFINKREKHDNFSDPGHTTIEYYLRDAVTGKDKDLTLTQYNMEMQKCSMVIRRKMTAMNHEPLDTSERIVRILQGEPDKAKLQELASSPDLMAYIREHGFVEKESEDFIDQYVFVEVSREDSACAQTFDE